MNIKKIWTIVFKINGKYYLADGWTRYYAYDKRNIEKVECEIHEGTEDDAFNFACRANNGHGNKRNNADIKRSVLNAIKRYPKKSDHAIAKICLVSHPTVGTVRKSLVNFTSQNNSNIGKKTNDWKMNQKPLKKP
jgi:hypothetical protein